jgi:hypothetical protein
MRPSEHGRWIAPPPPELAPEWRLCEVLLQAIKWRIGQVKDEGHMFNVRSKHRMSPPPPPDKRPVITIDI